MFLELNLEWLNLKFFINWLFWIFDDVSWAALYLDFRIMHKNVIMLIFWVMWVFLNLNLIYRWIPGVLLFLAAVIALHGTEDYLIFIFLATFFNWIAWCNKFILWNYLLIMLILNFTIFLFSLPASLRTILQSFRSLKFRKYLLSFDLFILSLDSPPEGYPWINLPVFFSPFDCCLVNTSSKLCPSVSYLLGLFLI